nr:HigA family addiction module antitoxin [Burkholderia ambifaria]
MTATHPGRFTNGMRPVHAGEILREEYLAPLGMTSNALAKALNVSLSTVDDLVNERHGVTPELALRLARYFGGDAESWLNLQQAYELKVARRAHGQRIETEIKPRDGASE